MKRTSPLLVPVVAPRRSAGTTPILIPVDSIESISVPEQNLPSNISQKLFWPKKSDDDNSNFFSNFFSVIKTKYPDLTNLIRVKITFSRVLMLLASSLMLLAITHYWSLIKNDIIFFLQWIQSFSFFAGVLIFSIGNIFAALFLLPCIVFTCGAGYLWGIFLGSIIVICSNMVASLLSFLFARYVSHGFVKKFFGEGSRFRAIDSAIKEEGFKIVFLLRLSPLAPYAVFNYLFGITSVSFKVYTLATFPAIIPSCVMEVYLGSAVKDLRDIMEGKVHETVAGRIFFWAGLLISIWITVYISLWVKNKFATDYSSYELVEVKETVSSNDNKFDM